MPARFPLILTPTPLHRLERASVDLGVDLWIKRDDLTGFAMGGNKGRKLEYLLADIIEQKAEAVVTCGAAQSNFVRQLGAACAYVGIECHAVVMGLPFEDAPPAEKGLSDQGGNIRLDEILGVKLRRVPDDTWESLYAQAEDLALALEAEGKRVYRIPVGGSSPLGAYGFFRAANELQGQLSNIDAIFFASSSGSTHTGLLMGLRHNRTRVIGVASDPEPEIAEDFAALGRGLAELLRTPPPNASSYELDFNFVGPGYGIPSAEGNQALEYLARREGIFLDPIYSAKAFACLRARAPEFAGKRVVFWHTGGTPALFA